MLTKKSIDKIEDFYAKAIENDFIFLVNDITKT